jgi:hypothetical protein
MSQDLDLDSSPGANDLVIPKPNGALTSGLDAISVLETKANGM